MIAKGGAEDRELDLRQIASQLGATSDELVRTLGVDGDGDGKHLRGRIRQMLDVLCKVEPRFGSARLAYAWYRSEPLPGFSGLTAMDLLRPGMVEEVLTTIDSVNSGIHT